MGAADLGYVGIALLTLSLGVLVFVVIRSPTSPPPVLGLRGWKRHEALTLSPALKGSEPVLRAVAGWFRNLPIDTLRQRADRQLFLSGDYLGLDPDGWFALCFLSGVLGLTVATASVLLFDLPPVLIPTLALLCAYLPYAAVKDTTTRRRRQINRQLPGAIDLIGLCVSAGLSFSSALQEVVARSTNPRDALVEELRQILRQLELGHSRAYALESFAARVPTDAVTDFVAAVVQSESKGTPLRDVLAAQAIILRARRSIMAEEAAARAAVQMTLPLALMLMTSFILIAGPLVLKTMEAGFFGD